MMTNIMPQIANSNPIKDIEVLGKPRYSLIAKPSNIAAMIKENTIAIIFMFIDVFSFLEAVKFIINENGDSSFIKEELPSKHRRFVAPLLMCDQ
jgi:hypothetical protein